MTALHRTAKAVGYIMKHKRFIRNMALITAGSFLAKGLGALYRIPLTNLLGGYGTGLYQMAYPFFCVLLTFSSAGIPSAFSRMIARETALGRENGSTVKVALKLFALLGLAGTALMCLFAPAMCGLQGDNNLLRCYFALAPSVFLVALIAVLRGYFQGKSDMKPTVCSELLEQIVKAAAGTAFALRYSSDPPRAVAYTLLAVTLSELAALAYLLMRYRQEKRPRSLTIKKVSGADVLGAAFPVMTAAALLPLSQTVDSILIVRLLARRTSRAVALYGLFSGGALSLVNLPASVCYGLAVAVVPAVSSCFARGEEEEGRRRALYALALTVGLAAPCAVGLFVFARPIVGLLYSSLSEPDAELLISVLRLTSVSAVTLASVDTLSACLTGMGRAKYAAWSMACAVAVKFALQILLVPSLSVGGAAIAANACYLVAFFLDLVYTVKKSVGRKRKHDYDHRLGDGEGRLHGEGAESVAEGGQSAAPHAVPLCGKFKRSGDRV